MVNAKTGRSVFMQWFLLRDESFFLHSQCLIKMHSERSDAPFVRKTDFEWVHEGCVATLNLKIHVLFWFLCINRCFPTRFTFFSLHRLNSSGVKNWSEHQFPTSISFFFSFFSQKLCVGRILESFWAVASSSISPTWSECTFPCWWDSVS